MENKSKDECFFIAYDDIIKAPIINIMKDVILKYHDYYKDFIELSVFRRMTEHSQFIDALIHRDHKNIFRSLCIKQFDYDRAWEDIYKRNPKLIIDSLLLPFGSSLFILLKQSFVQKIYIWTETYDRRVHFDIQENYGLSTVNYITGDFKLVTEELAGITCYVLDDIMKIQTLIDINKIELATVCIADYGYNYITTEESVKRELKITNLHDLENKYKFRSTLFKAIQN